MKELKRIVATVLIVSMIFTSHAFFTFADSLRNVDSGENALPSVEIAEDYDTATFSEMEEAEEENEDVNAEYVEEPEEDGETSEDTVVASEESVGMSEESVEVSEESVGESEDSVGANARGTNVGASSASPEETVGDDILSSQEESDETSTDEETVETSEDSIEASEDSVGANARGAHVGASSASPEEAVGDDILSSQEESEETSTGELHEPEEETVGDDILSTQEESEETVTTESTSTDETIASSSETESFYEVADEEISTQSFIELSPSSIDELIEVATNSLMGRFKQYDKLLGGGYDFDIEAHLYAYLNINTYEMRNYPDGYGKVSDSFGQRFPIVKYLFYQHDEGDGEDADDGKFYDFTYPSDGALNEVEGVYVLDDNNKPAYKLTGWQYLQDGQTYDLPSDISHLDEDNWWPYEWSGVSKVGDLDEWLQSELSYSHLGSLDYWDPYDDEVFLYLVPKWTPVSDEDEIYHVIIDSKKDLDYAELTKSYPDNFYVSKKNDSECYTSLEDKYFDASATDTGFTIDYANKTITLHSNTATADGISGNAFTCDAYMVEDTTFPADKPISFNDFFGNKRSVTLTPVWDRAQHTITIKYFDYKDNIDFNTETPVGTKELFDRHGQTSFPDLRNEELLLDLYKDADVSVFPSDTTFTYNANLDVENPSATEPILRYSIYKESHSDTIYMEKGRTILVGDATINLCIKRGATLKWKSKQYSNDYTVKFQDKNEDYVNIKNGRLPKFSEMPNTGIVFNFTINKYEYKDSSGNYHDAIDESPITSSELLEIFVSGTRELPGYPEVESFVIATPPNFVDYLSGDVFDPTGLCIDVTYVGVTETRRVLYDDHKSEFTFNPTLEDRIKPTDTHVTIIFGGKEVNQAITVDVRPHERAFYWWLEDIPNYSYSEDDKKLHLTSEYAEGRKMISGTRPVNYEGMSDLTRKRDVRIISIDDEIVPETCEEMFKDFEFLDDIENLSNLNTARAVSMKRMFQNTGDIDGNMEPMLKLNFSSFDTGNVTDMSEMFAKFTIRNLDLSSFDTSKVTTMASMFSESDMLISADVRSFDTSNVKDMSLMFYNCNQLSNLDVSKFDTGNVKDMNKMFYKCSSLKNLDFSEYEKFDTSSVTNMHEMFSEVGSERIILTNFVTSNVTDMGSMFAICGNLKEIDISTFDTSSLTNMQNMFYSSGNLTELDLSSFDTSKVTNMHSLFDGCTSLTTIYASHLFVTTALEPGDHSSGLFYNCPKLVGGNGTEWNEYHTAAHYARIDKEGEPGYFTEREHKPILRALEILNKPDKTNYKVGEHFDPTGLVVKLHYNDGTTKNVVYNEFTKSKFKFTPATSSELQVSNFVVTIRYENVITFQEITVSERADRSIDISVDIKPKKTSYIVGEHIDLTGLVLRMMLSNNKIITLSYEDKVDRMFIKYVNKTLSRSDKYITIDVFGATTDIPITVRSGGNPGGGNSGGSSSGSSDPTQGPMGDLTKNPNYANLLNQKLNTVNNIPQLYLYKDVMLAITLLSDAYNQSLPQTNVKDMNGNVGYGKWLKFPGTNNWYFLVGETIETNFLANGWFDIGWEGQSGKYRFDASGKMQTGWYQEGGKLYYFYENANVSNYGRAAVGTQTINGIVYNFDSNGALIA